MLPVVDCSWGRAWQVSAAIRHSRGSNSSRRTRSGRGVPIVAVLTWQQ